MKEIQDGGSNLALLAGVPGVLHRQQLLRLQPLLQVVYQLLACSGTSARLGSLDRLALSVSADTQPKHGYLVAPSNLRQGPGGRDSPSVTLNQLARSFRSLARPRKRGSFSLL